MTNSTKQEPRSASPPPDGGHRRELPLSGIRARVDKVNFEGLGRTKDDVLINISKEIFESRNFEDVILSVKAVKTKLARLDAFKGIGVVIDTSKGEHATANGYTVTYRVVEKNRVTGGAHTYLGNNNAASLVTELKLPNVGGRGEKVQFSLQRGTKHTSGFNLALIKPLMPWLWPNPTITTRVYQQGADAPWSGFRETDRGVLLELAMNLGSQVYHSVSWETVWRDISCFSDSAFAVREESGHTLKSSLKHCLRRDTRDHTVIPTTGSLLRLEQEFAGIGGNIGFHRHELELQYNIRFLQDFVLQAAVNGGVLKPSSSVDRYTSIADRFFIGGPLVLRGFKLYGVGPHSEGCALGANSFWVSGLHLYTPLPFRPWQGGFGELIRTHFFVNAGNIGHFGSNDLYRTMWMLTNKMRYSAGVGLVISFGGARFELNYVRPLDSQPGDKWDQGFQFGLGVHYV